MSDQLAPLLDQIKTNLRKTPDEASADVGYCATANLKKRRRIAACIAASTFGCWPMPR